MKRRTFKKIFSMHNRIYQGTHLSFISLMIVKYIIISCVFNQVGITKSILSVFASFFLAQISIWPALWSRIDAINSKIYKIFLSNLRTLIPPLLIISICVAVVDSIMIYSITKETGIGYIFIFFVINCIVSGVFILIHGYFYLNIIKIEYIAKIRKNHTP